MTVSEISRDRVSNLWQSIHHRLFHDLEGLGTQISEWIESTMIPVKHSTQEIWSEEF